ncbi:MAG TPA: Uma2 family endonuclease [Bryobacteraceae bacterium]|nr:Uma2 family endonuclease [Bryobacteraceae bacterium]
MGTATLLTSEEYLHLPDQPGKHELLDGELISLPPARHNHSKAARAFQKILLRVVDESRVWIFESYQVKRGWLIPDVSVTWPDQPVSGWLQGAPMLAIEIISPGNFAEEIDRKVDAYLEDGAAEVWIVYPERRRMSVFRKDAALRVTGEYRCDLLNLAVNLDQLIESPE